MRTYTEAVAWFAAAHLIPRTSHGRMGPGQRPRRAAVAGAPADPLQRRVRQQPVPGAAAVLPLARRGGAAPGPDDPAARPQGEKLVPVFTSEELSALAKTCQGRSFAQRRDTAIIAVLTATGIFSRGAKRA